MGRQSAQVKKLRILPTTAAQLARAAENRPEFLRAVPDLFGLGTRNEYSSREVWETDLAFARKVVTELLRRTGYYHGVVSGKGPDPYYEAIMRRIAPANRPLTILYLLDKCRFAKKCFRVGGHSIERLSTSELGSLGPSSAVCADFFPKEAIDSKSLADYWFVRITKSAYTAYNYDLDGEEQPDGGGHQLTDGKIGEFEVAAGYFATGAQTQFSLPSHLEALLGLALYSPAFFEIPAILVCEPKWRRIYIRYAPPQRSAEYKVDSGQWPSFEWWLQLYDSGLRSAKDSRPVFTAARRYLQATFASGDIFPGWTPELELIEYPGLPNFPPNRPDVLEDALLHYVFALEALLPDDEKAALAEKLAVACALLVGRDDREANFLRTFVKDAYRGRSRLVHGKNLDKPLDLAKLRRLCQRTLALVICCFATDRLFELDTFIRNLPISSTHKTKIKELQATVFPLLSDNTSLAD